MTDFLYYGEIRGLAINYSFASTSIFSNELTIANGCDPVAAHLLCRAATAATLTIPFYKEGEEFSYKWSYHGLLKQINYRKSKQGVIATINPQFLMDKVEDESQIYGDAKGSISYKQAENAELANEAPLLDMVDDLSYFLSLTLKKESVIIVMIALTADPIKPIKLCQGFMIQASPECNLLEFDKLRNKLNQQPARDIIRTPIKNPRQHLNTIINHLT